VAPLLDLDHRDLLPPSALPDPGDRGEEDRVIDASVQREMAQLIPHSRLKLSAGYGHGNSFADPDYLQEVKRARHVLTPLSDKQDLFRGKRMERVTKL
jgi:pimeloyl-ACP methyl ester carboxylesterase